jgi:Na+-transporting methylmalonyl-CoA/oxaloacetate decarboxylase gamma subunit
MKKVWSILLAMVLVISLMGCMKAKEVAPVAPEATTTEEAAPAAEAAPAEEAAPVAAEGKK